MSLNRTYTYNPAQQLCRSVEPETGATLMGYDNANNLKWSAAGLPSTQACETNGTSSAVAPRRVDRTFDGRNNLRALSFANGIGNQTWTYTPDGLPATITTNNTSGGKVVTNAYSYNKRRLMTSESVKRGIAAAWAIAYSYNANAQLATLTYPSGLAVSYAPNALGQPTQAGTYATSVSYFPNGAMKQFTYGNGIVHTLTQNTRGLPTRMTDCATTGTCASANRRLDLQYAYDQHGNVSAITDFTSAAKQTRGMTYDNLDRLTRTTSPSTVFNTASYGYDVLDNLTTVNITGGSQARNHSYVYDTKTRRLSQVKNTVGGAIIANLTYDVQGNLASKGPVGSPQSYSFDLGNRLRSVPNLETGYEYDGHGRRVFANTVGSGSILSQYANSGQVLYQEDNKQAKRLDYIYLGNRLVAYRERPLSSGTVTVKYQHTDALGSPIAVTNTAKALIESSEYEPFGQLVNKPLFDGPGYTGHVQDAATGLTYMQQRYYDPGIGRFLSVDPVTAYGGNMLHFNRYNYAYNNPYLFIDPDGKQACGKTSNCYESRNYDLNKAGDQTVVQSPNIDAAAVRDLPNYESTGSVENAVRFDESESGDVTTTQLSTETAVKGGVIESTIHGVNGSDAIGHSHPVGTSDPSPGPRDDIAVNAGFPNNIVHDGNVLVIEKVSGQFRVRILEDANLTPRARREIQRDVDVFQKRSQ